MSIPPPDLPPPQQNPPASPAEAHKPAIPPLLMGKSDEVIQAHYFYLKNVAMKLVKPEVASEIGYSDIVMNTLLVGISKGSTFKGESEGQLRSWLVGIMKNLNRRYRRDILRRNTISLNGKQKNTETDTDRIIHEVIDPNSHQPFDDATRHEIAALLTKAISQLPWRHKVVVEKYLFETQNFRLIAESLGIEKSAAEKRYQRALGQLRQMNEIRQIMGTT